MRLMASGCKNLLESGIARQLVFLGRGAINQSFNDLVRSYAITFGSEVHYDAMTQDRFSNRLDIFRRDMAPSVN